MDIPEYYRKFQDKSAQIESPVTPPPIEKDETEKTTSSIYRSNAFTIDRPADWMDKTIYTITGPVEKGIQHNVIITVEENNPFTALLDYVDWHIHTLERELKECRLIKKDKIVLTNGIIAYEAIFTWFPTKSMEIWQKQIFILVGKTGYKITASFTRETLHTLGPIVDRMIQSFRPLDVLEK
ncbi:MAG: DUF1795 domain-containing protein [Calditrichales bacterium]|nr:MAG: DUF1795 domain-containing protein [Calditrichales bacterium]